MTVLASDITLGSLVWSVAQTAEGTSAQGGLVVDADEETVTVLDDRSNPRRDPTISIYQPGSRRPIGMRQAHLVMIPIRDIGSIGPTHKRGMHEYAKAALLRAAMSPGLMTDADLALVHAALRVVAESGVRAP